MLEVQLEGIEGELRQNALAWLGDPPETPQARTNYLYAAQRKVERSLQALGYYRADVNLDITRGREIWSLLITVVPGSPVLLREVDIRLQGEAAEDAAFLKLV